MHTNWIISLAHRLLPFLTHSPAPTTSDSQILTFTPIHAHSHTFLENNTSPHLLFHNASATTSFLSLPDMSAFSVEEAETYLLDHPAPHIAAQPLTIRTRPMTIRRPRVRPPSILSWALSHRAATRPDVIPLPMGLQGNKTETWVAPDYSDNHGDWVDVEIPAPDVTDRQTLITLAKMASNAYVAPDSGEWWPVGHWNATMPFGWEPDADGLRGHVFADPTNSTVIISIKGTSAGVLGGGGPTAKNDKYNDNLLFSCCCARVDFSWSPVCDCYSSGYRCEQTCLEDALIAESVYATVGTNLYNNVTYMYPNATIWLVGHSLGGSVSALIGLSFGAPVLSIEAPGERLPASRLHLPLPPGMPAEKTGITHLYHTADPIPMGACTGAYSGCYAAGFALETSCHTGQTILYDTVTVKGWSVDVRTHRIGEIINKVLADPWPVDEGGKLRGQAIQADVQTWWAWVGSMFHKALVGVPEARDGVIERVNWWGWGRKGPKGGKGGDDDDDDDDDDDGWEKHGGVPKATAESDCVDCYKWEFGDGWDKKLAS